MGFQDALKWMQIAHPCPEGAFAPKKEIQKYQQCQIQILQNQTMWMQQNHISTSLLLSTDASYMTGDASDYLHMHPNFGRF